MVVDWPLTVAVAVLTCAGPDALDPPDELEPPYPPYPPFPPQPASTRTPRTPRPVRRATRRGTVPTRDLYMVASSQRGSRQRGRGELSHLTTFPRYERHPKDTKEPPACIGDIGGCATGSALLVVGRRRRLNNGQTGASVKYINMLDP